MAEWRNGGMAFKETAEENYQKYYIYVYYKKQIW